MIVVNIFLMVLSLILFILMFFSPILLIYGLYNINYEFKEDMLVMKFLGMKYLSIEYSNIEKIDSVNQFLFLKGKFENFMFNKGIKITLKDRQNNLLLAKSTIIFPKNREDFVVQLKEKCNV